MSRATLFNKICALVGKDSIRIDSPGSGWPGLATVMLPSGNSIGVAMHVSTVGPHARREYEKRFQNPGDRTPISSPSAYLPVIVGLGRQASIPVLVGLDGRSRLGRERRFSILFHSRLLEQAGSRGWSEYESSVGEIIFGFRPALFPIFVSALNSESDAGVAKASGAGIAESALASGMLDDDLAASKERARRAAEVIVRHNAFGRSVVRAYEGQCAMCGLDINLVQGAHIYPVSAPGSPDKVWNGLALCYNHHAAFDCHMIWVQPTSRRIRLRADLLENAIRNKSAQTFVNGTFKRLAHPENRAYLPKEEMFNKRYEYYANEYSWAQ